MQSASATRFDARTLIDGPSRLSLTIKPKERGESLLDALPAIVNLPEWLKQQAEQHLTRRQIIGEHMLAGLDQNHRANLLIYFRASSKKAEARGIIEQLETLQLTQRNKTLLNAIIHDTDQFQQALALANEGVIGTSDLFDLIRQELERGARTAERDTKLLQFCALWVQANKNTRLYSDDVKATIRRIQVLGACLKSQGLNFEAGIAAPISWTSVSEAKKMPDVTDIFKEAASCKKDVRGLKSLKSLAKDLKLYQIELFVAIDEQEFKKDKWLELPLSLERFSRWQMHLVLFLVDTILSYKDKNDECLRIISFIICLAGRLLDAKDYTSSFAIFSALQHKAVQALDGVWGRLKEQKHEMEICQELRLLFANEPYVHLRECLAKERQKKGYLPQLQLLDLDIEHEQKEPALVADMYNLQKVLLIYQRVKEEFQHKDSLKAEMKRKASSNIISYAFAGSFKFLREEKA